LNRAVKATLWAIPPVAFLVVLPSVLLSFLPSSATSQASTVLGINISRMVTAVAIFGIALASLSGLQTWAYAWSILKPVASSLHMLVSYTLLLFLLGFGDPMAFGTAKLSLSLSSLGSNMSGIGSPEVSIVSTFLALTVGVAVVLKACQHWMKYAEDKRFHALDLAGTGVAV